MIIYGWKAAHLRTQAITEKCPSCGNSNTIKMSAYQKYAHIFWVPLFPIGKAFVSQCNHCNQVLEKNALVSNFKYSYDVLREQVRVPFWTFSGLALVGILIVNVSISGQREAEENKGLIGTPMVGDVYEYRTEEKQYTLLKVNEVVGDTVYLLQHQFETNKITGLSDLRAKGDDAYFGESFGLLKSELASMLEKGDILDVNRKVVN